MTIKCSVCGEEAPVEAGDFSLPGYPVGSTCECGGADLALKILGDLTECRAQIEPLTAKLADMHDRVSALLDQNAELHVGIVRAEVAAADANEKCAAAERELRAREAVVERSRVLRFLRNVRVGIEAYRRG